MKYLFSLLLFLSASTFAACDKPFLDQTPPSPTTGLEEVCFTRFTVLYDANKKIPIYSAEYLSPKDAINSEAIERDDAFHVESQLDETESSKPSDYSKSGYDKGHLTPSHDAPTMKDQNETFSMANMVPQTAKSNQVAIRLIEAKIHDIAENGTGVHIVTGVIVGDNPSKIGNGVVVPDKTFKAVRFDDNSSCVWVFPNTKQLSPNELYSLESFNLKYGILPFPGIIEDQNISKLCN